MSAQDAVPPQRTVQRNPEAGTEGARSGRGKGLVPRGAVPSKRCVAIAHGTGKQCAKWAIVGGTVCPTHGGASPQVKEGARKRIASLAPAALQVLASIMEDKDAPAAARVRAACDLLDRGGYKAAEEHIITPGVPNHELDDAIAEALRQRALLVGSQAADPGHEDQDPAHEDPGPAAHDAVGEPFRTRTQNLPEDDPEPGPDESVA